MSQWHRFERDVTR